MEFNICAMTLFLEWQFCIWSLYEEIFQPHALLCYCQILDYFIMCNLFNDHDSDPFGLWCSICRTWKLNLCFLKTSWCCDKDCCVVLLVWCVFRALMMTADIERLFYILWRKHLFCIMEVLHVVWHWLRFRWPAFPPSAHFFESTLYGFVSVLLGCIECLRCRLFLPMFAVSVSLSVTRLKSGGGPCSVRRVPGARGHSAQPLSYYFDQLLPISLQCMVIRSVISEILSKFIVKFYGLGKAWNVTQSCES